MTPEMAERVLSRRSKDKPGLSESQRLEILMDWLQSRTYQEIMAKHKVTKSRVSEIVTKTRKQARAVLEHAAH